MAGVEGFSVYPLKGMPEIKAGDDVAQIIYGVALETGTQFNEQDILCVASKAVASAEDTVVDLATITAGDLALSIHERIPRKDARAIQAIIDATGDPTGARLLIREKYIAGWLPNGLLLTSAGVDKHGNDRLILLPTDADASARAIGHEILEKTGVNVAVIITDSEGRQDKRGSAQIAIGVYGIPPIRISQVEAEDGDIKTNEETLCDMLAATAGILMGQRGFNCPAVIISGVDYTFDSAAQISQALNGNTLK